MKWDKFGQIWVGQHSMATDNLYLLSLGGHGVATTGDIGLTMGGFHIRPVGAPGAGNINSDHTWGNFMPSFDQPRADIVRYDSPSLAGCVFSASWGEDDDWDVAARCKKELNSVKILFGIGYIERNGVETRVVGHEAGDEIDNNTFIVSGSIIHDPTGLYVTSWYGNQEFAARTSTASGACVVTVGNPNGCADNDVWYINVGIYRRFNDLGKTSIYFDYENFDDANAGTAATGLVGGGFINSTETEVWGFGIVQKIDAAAMELYADYKHAELDVQSCDNATGTVCVNQNLEDFDRVLIGGRIRF
jgi:hypothetical protein